MRAGAPVLSCVQIMYNIFTIHTLTGCSPTYRRVVTVNLFAASAQTIQRHKTPYYSSSGQGWNRTTLFSSLARPAWQSIAVHFYTKSRWKLHPVATSEAVVTIRRHTTHHHEQIHSSTCSWIYKALRTIRTIRRGAVTRSNPLFLITPYNSFRSYFYKFNLHNAKRQWSPLLFAFAQGALSPCVPIHRITLFGYSIHVNDFGPISGCILSFTPDNFLFRTCATSSIFLLNSIQ